MIILIYKFCFYFRKIQYDDIRLCIVPDWFKRIFLYSNTFSIALPWAKNSGRIRLVTSPYLSEKDKEAIRKGYESRDEVIQNALLNELHEPQNYIEQEQLNLLANLISDGILDIKIAFTDKYGDVTSLILPLFFANPSMPLAILARMEDEKKPTARS